MISRGRFTWFMRRWDHRNETRGVSAPVTVLDNVRSLELASYAVQGGWRPGFSADPREITKLPLGLRVRVDHARFGEIVVTVSLR